MNLLPRSLESLSSRGPHFSVRRLYWRVAWLLAVHSLREWLLADSPGVHAARKNDVES
jgi:hypothetical protein